MDFHELVREVKNGSAAAQKCLFDQLAPRMLALCRRYVKSTEDAEELMLDGFCKFFRHMASYGYRGDGSLFAWLKRIMINECLMFLRKKNLFVMVADGLAEELPFEEDALGNLSADEIYELILQLPAGYRTVFNLHAIEGMEHKEIAATLGISEGTSKSQLSKARTLLQKMLLKTHAHYAARKSK
jgi:RNA polymerase sigma-70 factor (ECF subfamily)